MVRKALLIVALIIAVFTVVSCQTVQGIGNDITWIGKAGADMMEK